ncbi:MAG: hypothetical protein ACKV2T_06395 [Kofleriaceae bacterium]
MKLGFTLIVIAALAGLVGSLAPIDGFSLLPALIQLVPLRGIAIAAGFAAPLFIALFALAKGRMSKALGVACLAGFLAAGAAMEIWNVFKALGDNMSITMILIAGGIVLGVVGSLVALAKGNND